MPDISEREKELEKKVTELETQNKELKEKVVAAEAKVTNLDAIRNTSAVKDKELFAYNAVLKKHNIEVDVKKLDLTAVTVSEDGTVSGEVKYEPQAPQPKGGNEMGGQPSGSLTLDAVKQMSISDINKHWDKVSEVLASEG